ncbi:hypothetical protein [Pseudarthrobacter sulfonivorans]|uniref:hypothetical protein n=1 Tax=Pseudarthrobacter sulfonivorans TaxID=121292 RepID=UPI002103DCDA|nr:hypothetical protein [Pseudarthrobacter sulfonivorans]
MSAINAYFEPLTLDPVSAPSSGRDDWPVHCATEMEMVVPAVGGTAVEYTFEPEAGPVRLPPVWRCRCGFQLDAWATGWPEPAEAPGAPEQLVPALTARA